ncbi:MAG: AraC family transcriptional regulator [Aliidongia sp.]
MIARLDEDIALEEIARECGLSRSHFLRAFKRTAGLPPHRWLMAQRVERAKELLLGTTTSLSAIAAACGFADQSHFTRVFSRIVGTTPGAWQRDRKG